MFPFLPDLDVNTLAALLLTAFLAGIARGFSGFGAALIFVPVASALIGPRVAVPLFLVTDIVAAIGMIPDAWKRAERRDVGTMAIGGFIGVPLGAYALTVVDPLVLRWAIVALVIGLLALIISGWRYKGDPNPAATAGVGLVSGVLSGAAQVGGPPIVAYWLGRPMTSQTVRANIVIYFAISSVFGMVSYVTGGLITREVLTLALVMTPVFAVAIWLGSHLFSRSDEIFFRWVCYGLIAIAAILGMPVWY